MKMKNTNKVTCGIIGLLFASSSAFAQSGCITPTIVNDKITFEDSALGILATSFNANVELKVARPLTGGFLSESQDAVGSNALSGVAHYKTLLNFAGNQSYISFQHTSEIVALKLNNEHSAALITRQADNTSTVSFITKAGLPDQGIGCISIPADFIGYNGIIEKVAPSVPDVQPPSSKNIYDLDVVSFINTFTDSNNKLLELLNQNSIFNQSNIDLNTTINNKNTEIINLQAKITELEADKAACQISDEETIKISKKAIRRIKRIQWLFREARTNMLGKKASGGLKFSKKIRNELRKLTIQ